MKQCIDCFYASSAGGYGTYKCRAHKKIGSFDGFTNACSSFVSDDKAQSSCEFCAYYESGGYRWSTTGKCSIKGTKVKGDSPSCYRYVED